MAFSKFTQTSTNGFNGQTKLLDVAETILGLGIVMFLVGLGFTVVGTIMRMAHWIYTSRRDRPRTPDAL